MSTIHHFKVMMMLWYTDGNFLYGKICMVQGKEQILPKKHVVVLDNV